MCGRFTLHTERELLEGRFKVDLKDLVAEARYNIAPSQPVLTIRQQQEERRPTLMHWGLIPYWSKERSKSARMINARIETLAQKPAYREPFRRRRCLIPADGFYEWSGPRGARGKVPHWISLRDAEPFAIAGLWDEWRPRDELDLGAVQSCTIITAPANSVVAPLHERMPVILRPEAESAWLDPALDGQTAELLKLLEPLPGERWVTRPVSRRVNTPDNDGPELIEAYDDPSLGF